MKKILLGTTAVVALATMTTEAFAADKIALSLGGFMRHYLGYTSSDEVASTNSGAARDKRLSQFSNTEIYFQGSTTLDNGIGVKTVVQLEADSAATADNIDLTYMTLSSDAMGAVSIGATPHAADDFLVRVPNAGNFDWGDTDSWGGVATSATAATGAFATSAGDITDTGSNGSAKLKYVSPSFSGVTVYASYSAAEGSGTHDARRLAGTLSDGSTMGIAYEGEMGGASVSADLTRMNWGTRDSANNLFGVTTNHFGLNVGMAGFTVGGGYSDFNDEGLNQSNYDGNAWELGVGYETGPYALTAGYMVAKNKGTAGTAGDNKDTKWALDATYDMGAGVKLAAKYFQSKADPEGTGTTVATGKSTKISGLIAGIEVGF